MNWIYNSIAKLPDQKLRIFGITLLTMGAVDGLFGFVAFSMNQRVLGGVMLSLAAGFLFVLFPLLINGFWMFTRIAVPYFAASVLFVGASYYGPSINVQLTIFIGAIYPFVVFNSKDNAGILFTAPVPVLFYLIVEYTGYKALDNFFGGNFHVNAFDADTGRVITLSSFIVVSSTMYIFVRQAGKYYDKLQNANENLDVLIRTVCHDIRNPLMVSLGYSKMIGKSLNSDEQRKIDAILRANVQIESIIKNVIEMQKVKTGKFNLILESISLEKVLEDCIFVLQDRIKQKGLQIDYHCPTQFQVRANQSILAHSVINNILTNAIKFSRSGSKIVIHTSAQENGLVKIAIRDHGVGIPDSILKNLFNPSAPTTRRGTNNENGTGFGMPIAKAYIEAMGGEINVSSRTEEASPEDHGTSFEITLKSA